MKKIFLTVLFLMMSSVCFAQPGIIPIGKGTQTDTNCNQAKYFTIGTLCQDTDDGKLYKGTGAAVVEITAGVGTGDVLADGTVPFTGAPIPNAANTIALGSAAAEWADLFLGDGGILYGQNDQSNQLISSSVGWRSPVGFAAGTASTTTGTFYFYNSAAAHPFGLFAEGSATPTVGWRFPAAMAAGDSFVTVDTNGYLGYSLRSAWQASDADLTTWAGITPGTGVGTALGNNANATGGFLTYGNAAVLASPLTGYSSGAGTVADTDTILQAFNKLNGNNDLKLNIANSAMTGDATLTDATPTFICNDSTNAAGTCGFFANSSGGANDIIWSFGVEDSTGASTEYFQIDGVTETVDFLKPVTLPNAGYVQSAATTAGHTYSLKVYDNTAGSYKDALIFTNGTTGNYKVSLGAGVTLDGLGSLSLGGIVLGDTTPDADGEIGYATNAFLGFANSEDFKITASANLWTFDSNTSATFAFTPAVNFAGGLTEEGNAIYNSSETPGGELEGTWASPTIDDTGITLTSITIGSLLGVDSIDATGAVDMDYGSDDITDHTFISDGGTTIIDGSSITTSSANDPYVFLNETDGTKWYMGVDDAGDELEFRSSATVGSGIFFKLGEGGNEMLLSTTTVSFAADADTTLYTVPTGRRCVLTKAVIVAAADAGSTDITIGQDTAESDWLPTNQLDNLDAQYDAIIVMPVPATTPTKIKSYAAATVIQINVANQAGAAGNTVYLYGILY